MICQVEIASKMLFADYVDVVADIFSIIGIIGLILFFLDFRRNSKKTQFEIISSCVQRFHNIAIKLGDKSDDYDIIAYLELVNEELFYFENKMLPYLVAEEWISGMIDYLPIFNSKGEILNDGNFVSNIEKFIYNYPRIVNTFTISMDKIVNEYIYIKSDFQNVHTKYSKRKYIVNLILNNLKK